MLLVIGSAAANAATTLDGQASSRTESANAIVTYMVLLMTPMSLAPALFVWQMPPVWTWAFLVGMGLAGTLGHLCYVRAFRMADASAVLPYDYGRMIFAAFIGYFAFAEIPDRWTWIGSALIAGSADLHRPARSPAGAAGSARRKRCPPALRLRVAAHAVRAGFSIRSCWNASRLPACEQSPLAAGDRRVASTCRARSR